MNENLSEQDKLTRQLLQAAGTIGLTTAQFTMIVFTNMAPDPAMECVRYLRQIPYFQRHRGRQLVNRLHKAIVMADAQVCNECGGNISLIEEATSAKLDEIEANGLADYRNTIRRILIRNDYEYPEAYANVVLASSICEIVWRFQKEHIIGPLCGITIQADSNGMCAYTGTRYGLPWFSQRSCKEISGVLDIIRREFDRIPSLSADFSATQAEEREVQNKSRNLVQVVLDVDTLLDTVNRHSRKAS